MRKKTQYIVVNEIYKTIYCGYPQKRAWKNFTTAEGGAPIFYNAKRLGQNGRTYKMFKLRSMKVNAPDLRNKDGSTFNGDDDPRVTTIGRIMRKTSLDEFPQFLNVLLGDMSLIGPRPTVPVEWAKGSKLIVITAHRRENLGEPMHHMFRAIRRIIEEHPDVKAVYPIHMNPLVRQAAEEELSGCDRIRIIEPLEVIEFHNLLSRSYLILTDSGGIQEEAPSLGKPVLVMRDTTERPEGIAAGTLKLVGTDEEVIYQNFKELLENQHCYNAMAYATNPYGDGKTSQRIADILEYGYTSI